MYINYNSINTIINIMYDKEYFYSTKYIYYLHIKMINEKSSYILKVIVYMKVSNN